MLSNTVEKDVTSVEYRLIPLVAYPLGSTEAKQNSICALPINSSNSSGV